MTLFTIWQRSDMDLVSFGCGSRKGPTSERQRNPNVFEKTEDDPATLPMRQAQTPPGALHCSPDF